VRMPCYACCILFQHFEALHLNKGSTGAEKWHAPRLSLYDSLREPDSLQQLAPAHSKDYLLKWDLDITRFHTEDLVCHQNLQLFHRPLVCMLAVAISHLLLTALPGCCCSLHAEEVQKVLQTAKKGLPTEVMGNASIWCASSRAWTACYAAIQHADVSA